MVFPKFIASNQKEKSISIQSLEDYSVDKIIRESDKSGTWILIPQKTYALLKGDANGHTCSNKWRSNKNKGCQQTLPIIRNFHILVYKTPLTCIWGYHTAMFSSV